MNTPPSNYTAPKLSPPASTSGSAPLCTTPRPAGGGAPVVSKGVRDGSLGGTGLVKTLGALTFSSAFDSANLKDVRWNAASSEHELVIANDCDGTPHQTRNSSWFYFSVSGLAPGQAIHCRVMNSNRQPGLYRGGFKPVAKSLPSAPVWQRLASEVVVCDEKRDDDGGANRFEVAFAAGLGAGAQPDGEVLFVAMTYPYG